MSNFIALFLVNTTLGLPQGFNPAAQTVQELNAKQIQSYQSEQTLMSLNSSEIKVAYHNSKGVDPSDPAPKAGDGRRDE